MLWPLTRLFHRPAAAKVAVAAIDVGAVITRALTATRARASDGGLMIEELDRRDRDLTAGNDLSSVCSV